MTSSDRWVNARVTVVIPMTGVSPDESAEAKSDALDLAMDDVASYLPDVWFAEHGAVMSASWEDMEASDAQS